VPIAETPSFRGPSTGRGQRGRPMPRAAVALSDERKDACSSTPVPGVGGPPRAIGGAAQPGASSMRLIAISTRSSHRPPSGCPEVSWGAWGVSGRAIAAAGVAFTPLRRTPSPMRRHLPAAGRDRRGGRAGRRRRRRGSSVCCGCLLADATHEGGGTSGLRKGAWRACSDSGRSLDRELAPPPHRTVAGTSAAPASTRLHRGCRFRLWRSLALRRRRGGASHPSRCRGSEADLPL